MTDGDDDTQNLMSPQSTRWVLAVVQAAQALGEALSSANSGREVARAYANLHYALADLHANTTLAGVEMRNEPPWTGPAIQEREHVLRVWPRYFEGLLDGTKPFELRRNDRDFRVGDVLSLLEWDPAVGKYTRRWVRCRVTYVTDGAEFGALAPGFVCMGLEGIDAETESAPEDVR